MAYKKKPKKRKLVEGGEKHIPLNDEMKQLMEKQLQAFKDKFGREPGPDDPIFFDPSKDTPTPIPASTLNEDLIKAAVLAGMDGPKVYAAAYTERLVSTENAKHLTKAELEEWDEAVYEAERVRARWPKWLPLAISMVAKPFRPKLVPLISAEAGCTEAEAAQLLASIDDLDMVDQIDTLKNFVLKAGDEVREVSDTKMGKMDRLAYGALCQQMGREDTPYNEYVMGQRDHAPTVDEVIREGAWYGGVAETYLTVMRSMKGAFDTTENKERRKYFGVLWSMLRDTNIFSMPEALYEAFFTEAGRYVKSMLEHLGHEVPDDDYVPDIDNPQGIDDFISAAKQVPMPERLPFPSSYFGYDPPVELEESDWSSYDLDELPVEIIRAFLVGHLVTRKRAFAFIMVESDTFGIIPIEVRKGGEWEYTNHLEPWVLTSILEWVNDHMTVVEENSQNRRRLIEGLRNLERALGLKKGAPPPYYTVYMRDSYRRQINAIYQGRRKLKVEWQHRWAVRGHHVVRIRRGDLPIDPALHDKLIDRKYRVFTTSPPDADTAQHLARRRVPGKKAHEWMAVLVSWRSEHVKGPEWAPFIPATRKSARITKVDKDSIKRAMRP